RTLDPPAIYKGIHRVLLIEPSDLFGAEVIVSLYVTENDYERLVGVGRVLSVQVNGSIQVGITAILDGHQDIVSQLNGNDAEFLKKLIVKPSVAAYILEASRDE